MLLAIANLLFLSSAWCSRSTPVGHLGRDSDFVSNKITLLNQVRKAPLVCHKKVKWRSNRASSNENATEESLIHILRALKNLLDSEEMSKLFEQNQSPKPANLAQSASSAIRHAEIVSLFRRNPRVSQTITSDLGEGLIRLIFLVISSHHPAVKEEVHHLGQLEFFRLRRLFRVIIRGRYLVPEIFNDLNANSMGELTGIRLILYSFYYYLGIEPMENFEQEIDEIAARVVGVYQFILPFYDTQTGRALNASHNLEEAMLTTYREILDREERDDNVFSVISVAPAAITSLCWFSSDGFYHNNKKNFINSPIQVDSHIFTK